MRTAQVLGKGQAAEAELQPSAPGCTFLRPHTRAFRGALDVLFRSHPSLVRAFGSLDVGTRAHLRRVCELGGDLATALDLPPAGRRAAEVAGLLHDLGKMIVPRTILEKPARLDALELHLLHLHPLDGESLARPIGDPVVLDAIRHHHERLDGTGYPDGIPANRLSEVTRIVAVADVYDALTSDRPYRTPLPVGEALHRVSELAGTKLDPEIVDALVRLKEHTCSQAA